MDRMKRVVIVITSLLWMLPQGMMAQKQSAKPWTFWYWMYGAVSKEGIHADLQGMKDIGLGGFYLMPIRGTAEKPEYEGRAEQLTPTFWDMVAYAMQQADSLGLEMGVHVSDGFALAGGPWISPEESMQKIVYSDTVVVGKLPKMVKKGLTLRRPIGHDSYYEDIATFVIPLRQAPLADIDLQRDHEQFAVTLSPTMTRNQKGVYAAAEPTWLQIDAGRSRTFRNVEIAANGTNMQAQRMAVEASDDGEHFRLVEQLVPPRQGWQNYDYNTTFAFPPTTARYWRLTWTPVGTEPGSEDLDAAKWRPRLGLKNAVFSEWPRIDSWEGKAGYCWRIARETTAEELSPDDCVEPSAMCRLELEGDNVVKILGDFGSFKKTATYRILRIGHTSTGYTNATAGGGKGLECDKFSKEAVNKQVDGWFARFDSLARTLNSDLLTTQLPTTHLLKYLHVDSWECGGQNWSRNFADEFKARRGYDLLPYLPVMVGVPVESAAKSEQVLRDVRLTINDLIHDVFFATVRDRAHQMGMKLSSEAVAPTMVSDGLQHYDDADIPMGEYWLNSPTHDKPNDMLDAISGAHIYGKPVVQAEGFTEVRGVWNETPAMIKPLLDRHFALGMNKLFFHVTAHNPWLDRRPGMTLDGIGLFFQRDNTWYRESKGLVDYITRCQEFLQRGRPVVDIAVFTGEEIPCRAVLPERLLPMLPGLFGRERVEAERRRLLNEGQPMEESPVGVWHSAGITTSEDWVNPLRGYHYDSMNKDALMRLATVEDSCIALPGGARYRVLVVPEYHPQSSPVHPIPAVYSQEVLDKIESFRRAGVIVIDKPFAAEDFSAYGLPRDVELPRQVAYTHIPMDADSHFYFLSNQENRERVVTVSFRGEYVKAILANPLTGKGSVPKSMRVVNGRTEVELSLSAYESVFVGLFRQDVPVKLLPQMKGRSQAIDSPWETEYQSNGCHAVVTLPDDWSGHEQAKEKYYSGHVAYTNTFRYSGDGERVSLSLGEVHDVAHVYVNGVDCGVAWTAPYEVDVTNAVRRGKNTLRIEVVNTWHNALKGADAGLPPFEGIWTNARYRTKGEELLPAGLFGPVQLKW